MSIEAWARSAFGAHYSRLYRHRDDDEARRAVALVDRIAGLDGARVLDLGCGAGRHLGPLAGSGACVVGMDQSPELLSEAHDEVPEAAGSTLVRGDWGRLPFAANAFDVVVSLFTAFGYGEHPGAQQSMIAEIARTLAPGGHWILDYLNPRRVRSELAKIPPPRLRVLEGLVMSEQRRLSPDGRRVTKAVTITPDGPSPVQGIPAAGLSYEESVALIDLDELDELAATADLFRSAAAGDYDGAAFDPDTSVRWFLVYRKEVTA